MYLTSRERYIPYEKVEEEEARAKEQVEEQAAHLTQACNALKLRKFETLQSYPSSKRLQVTLFKNFNQPWDRHTQQCKY